MNKKLTQFPFLLIVLCTLSGCLEIPMGYTPGTDLIISKNIRKYDLTFSVDYLSDGDVSIGRASQTQYIEHFKEYLQESGAFAKVSYKNFSEKSKYHVHFVTHYSCMPVNEAIATGYLMGMTFCAIPMWVNMYLDMSAILYLNGKPVYSSATSENLRCYVWIPFLPAGLIWNQWWAWTTQEKKCCRYLVNSISEYQKMKNLVKSSK